MVAHGTLVGLPHRCDLHPGGVRPNERIVDRNPDAPRGVAFRFEPDATGTTRIMAWLDSCRVPLLTRAWGRIY